MYEPRPIDVSGVTISPELAEMTEQLAENAHDVWARERLANGWSYGLHRDDQAKKTLASGRTANCPAIPKILKDAGFGIYPEESWS